MTRLGLILRSRFFDDLTPLGRELASYYEENVKDSGYETTYFYSLPSSIRVTYTGSSNYGPGYLKTVTVGAYSKARLVFHHHPSRGTQHSSDSNYVVSLLEKLKIADVTHKRPSRIRLNSNWQ